METPYNVQGMFCDLQFILFIYKSNQLIDMFLALLMLYSCTDKNHINESRPYMLIKYPCIQISSYPFWKGSLGSVGNEWYALPSSSESNYAGWSAPSIFSSARTTTCFTFFWIHFKLSYQSNKVPWRIWCPWTHWVRSFLITYILYHIRRHYNRLIY